MGEQEYGGIIQVAGGSPARKEALPVSLKFRHFPLSDIQTHSTHAETVFAQSTRARRSRVPAADIHDSSTVINSLTETVRVGLRRGARARRLANIARARGRRCWATLSKYRLHPEKHTAHPDACRRMTTSSAAAC